MVFCGFLIMISHIQFLDRNPGYLRTFAFQSFVFGVQGLANELRRDAGFGRVHRLKGFGFGVFLAALGDLVET